MLDSPTNLLAQSHINSASNACFEFSNILVY